MNATSHLNAVSQVYKHGFWVDVTPSTAVASEASVPTGYVSVHRLLEFAASLYPSDHDLAFYTWKILLRDSTFFELAYPGFAISGRRYTLVVRHISTHQTRQEWLQNPSHDVKDLLDPRQWIIQIDSLLREWHKLYIHELDGRNACRDSFYHETYVASHPRQIQEYGSPELVAQAQIQGYTVCIFAFLRRWVLTWL